MLTNPRLYQLTSLGQSTGLWWDSFEEDLEELGMGGENVLGSQGSLLHFVFRNLSLVGLVEWLNYHNYLEHGLPVQGLDVFAVSTKFTESVTPKLNLLKKSKCEFGGL